MDVKQLNKIIKLYYFHVLKALWEDQDKIRMYYGMSRFEKQLSGKGLLLNKWSEVMVKFCHENKFLLSNYKTNG